MTVASPTSVITGIVVSSTCTVLVTCVASLPEVSATLYLTEYTPTIAVFTVDTVTILEVKSPSELSVAVAPASVYSDPTSTVTVASPSIVITGIVVSKTCTVLVTVLLHFLQHR